MKKALRTNPPASQQGTLGLPEAQKPSNTRRFEEFHRKNPSMWRLFKSFTQDRIKAGFAHYGARDILHRIRWETETAENGAASGFKVNNVFSPFYARLFHRTYPQHAGFFRTRAAEADRQ